jgi:hypothetical protein
MTIINQNFTRKLPENVEPGTEFVRCNFSKRISHTKLFDGIAGLKFVGCNLLNCDLPDDAVVDDCLVHHADVIEETEQQ